MAQKPIISVSVGEKRFTLFRKKLKDLNSSFGDIILGLVDGDTVEHDSIMLDEDEKGPYVLIDADASDFQHFMDYMRSRQTALVVKTEEELRRMLVFATTWKINDLENDVRDRLAQLTNESAAVTGTESAAVTRQPSKSTPVSNHVAQASRKSIEIEPKSSVEKNRVNQFKNQMNGKLPIADSRDKVSQKTVAKLPESSQSDNQKPRSNSQVPLSSSKSHPTVPLMKNSKPATAPKVDRDSDDSDSDTKSKQKTLSSTAHVKPQPDARKEKSAPRPPRMRGLSSDEEDDQHHASMVNRKRKQSIDDDAEESRQKYDSYKKKSSAAGNEIPKQSVKEIIKPAKPDILAASTAAEEKSKKISRFAKQPIELFALTKPTMVSKPLKSNVVKETAREAKPVDSSPRPLTKGKEVTREGTSDEKSGIKAHSRNDGPAETSPSKESSPGPEKKPQLLKANNKNNMAQEKFAKIDKKPEPKSEKVEPVLAREVPHDSETDFVTTGEPRFFPLQLSIPNFFNFDQLQNTRDTLQARGAQIADCKITTTDQVRDFVREQFYEMDKKKKARL